MILWGCRKKKCRGTGRNCLYSNGRPLQKQKPKKKKQSKKALEEKGQREQPNQLLVYYCFCLQTKNNTKGYMKHKKGNGPKANEPRNLKTKMSYRKKKLSPIWEGMRFGFVLLFFKVFLGYMFFFQDIFLLLIKKRTFFKLLK